jgi:thymidylate synthase (FAD)
MADMTVEIETSRAIAQQILRHGSFKFQEFSQRYSVITGFETYNARSQDLKNRQNSVDNMSEETKGWFLEAQQKLQEKAQMYYESALSLGIAKEQARFLLPLSTTTKMYMKGSIRSWITYLQVRLDVSTQKEHRDIAEKIKEIFIQQLPTVAEAMEWN